MQMINAYLEIILSFRTAPNVIKNIGTYQVKHFRNYAKSSGGLTWLSVRYFISQANPVKCLVQLCLMRGSIFARSLFAWLS